MRLPTRTRGLLGGLALLAVSPILALAGAHATSSSGAPQSAAPSRTAAPVSSVVTAERELPPPDAVVDIRSPEAPPAPPVIPPPPVSTPQPTALPTAEPTPTPLAVRVLRTPVPTATPAPSNAPPAAAGSIQSIIQAAAARYGVSYPWMLKIAQCESGLNPRAYNPAGPYIGLFQFLPSTFAAHGGTNIYDPVQQSNITASMLANGQSRAWGCA